MVSAGRGRPTRGATTHSIETHTAAGADWVDGAFSAGRFVTSISTAPFLPRSCMSWPVPTPTVLAVRGAHAVQGPIVQSDGAAKLTPPRTCRTQPGGDRCRCEDPDRSGSCCASSPVIAPRLGRQREHSSFADTTMAKASQVSATSAVIPSPAQTAISPLADSRNAEFGCQTEAGAVIARSAVLS